MYELRILSGLHRGATLPLDEHPHQIGASDDADVVLVDGCIAQQHATLSRSGTGWILTAAEGTLHACDSNLSQALIDLAEGDFVRLADVWITVAREGAAWIDPPPLPVDDLFDPVDDAPLPTTEEIAAAPIAQEIGNQAPVQRDDITDTPEPMRERSVRRFLLIPVVAMVVLSAAAYAITSRNPSDAVPKRLDLILSDSLSMPKETDNTATAASGDKRNGNSAPKAIRVLSQDELQRAFRKKLSDADLSKRFDITLADRSWSLQGDLNDDETRRFERILQTFLKEHNITFPVSAKIVSAEGMLPFKIRQVITGANASVVTQEGERLYVGEEYRGVRVVAIRDNHLTFAGKRKIEMNW